MNLDEFGEQIARMVRRTANLREQALREPDAGPLLYQALEELRTSLEELTVAQEELRDRNAALMAANAETERSRQRYRDLFLNAPVGDVVTDRVGAIVEINAAACAMLGEGAEAMRGQFLVDRVAAAERSVWSQWIENACAVQHAQPLEAHMHTTTGDAWFLCRAFVAVERGADDAVVALRFILLDASVELRARDAERLAQEARHKDNFLATLAHELRNPLAPIRAAVTLWREHGGELTDDRRRWSVDVVARQVEHLSHLVDEILDVSRVTHGKIRLRRSVLDLRDVVDQAHEAVKASAQRHELRVEHEDAPLFVDGDTTRLRQILVNIVENALRYTPAGAGIVVRTRREANDCIVEVCDEGVGIAPGDLEAVFDLFHQNESATGLGAAGLGLGLALVRKLVDLHGGTVSARSEGLGHGATFLVRLPRVEAPHTERAPSESQLMRLGARKLLVVDDNVDGAQMLATFLEAEGHHATIVYDGMGAMESFETVRPDVVLLDLGLPDVDGLEVGRHLRARSSKVVLVAVTGYGDESTRARTRESGFDHHLLKPIDFDKLLGTLYTRR
jgi:signal transduction histidine kinase